MNKLAIALSATLAIGASSSAFAQSGTITFNGEVTATTCQVTFPGTGGSATDPIVTLPTVATTALATAGNTAGKTPVTVQIGTAAAQCAGNSVAVELNPNRNADQTNGRLNNTDVAGATNVQVALRDANDAEIDLSTPWSSQRVNLVNGVAEVEFAGEYYATGAATAGAVSSNVQYTLDYN